MTRRPTLALALVVPLLLSACGGDDAGEEGASSDDVRTIDVEMVDLAYAPSEVEVEAGETVRFVFANNGEALHEAFVGDAAAQDDHAEEMGDGGEMGMEEMEEGVDVEVEPGETGELTYTFDDPGEVQIGCHQPGHYEAGMVMDVAVG